MWCRSFFFNRLLSLSCRPHLLVAFESDQYSDETKDQAYDTHDEADDPYHMIRDGSHHLARQRSLNVIPDFVNYLQDIAEAAL